jgi:hypothetical protein
MKKILLLIDHENLSDATLGFISQLNKQERILVSGVFMPHYYYNHVLNYGVLAGEGIVSFPVQEENKAALDKGIARFEQFCAANNIACKVQKELLDFALPALKKETRFADLVILNAGIFSALGPDNFEMLRKFLHGSECACLVLPDEAAFPYENILAYDGSDEAVYALKQFCYLFPQMSRNETMLVYVDENEMKDFPERACIIELASQHFPRLRMEKLQMNPKKNFSNWVSEKKGAMLISGSFTRSVLSEIFSSSFVDDIIKKQMLPVFIAHK